MKHFIPNWFSHYLRPNHDRERENALGTLGLTETDLQCVKDIKAGKIRLIRTAEESPYNKGLEIADLTYRGLYLLGGTAKLVQLGPKKLLKSARDTLNTKALSPIELSCLFALLAAYRQALKENTESKSLSIQSKKPYRARRQRAKRVR